MAVNFHDDNGVRFEYPHDWEIDLTEDGPRNTVTVQSPDGPAFAMVTTDTDRPSPKDVVAEAVEALKAEYPEVEASGVDEKIDGHATIGVDVEFFTLDMTSSCVLRCFRTPRRTIFVMCQWSDADAGDAEDLLHAVRKSLEETDS